MKTIKTQSGGVIKIYESARELTIERYTDFQKYLAIQSGMGSDMQSCIARVSRLEAYLLDDKKEDCLTEVENLKNCLNAVFSGVGYYTIAFAVLVAEINGKPCRDLTLSGYQSVISELKEMGISQGQVEDEVEDVKKK